MGQAVDRHPQCSTGAYSLRERWRSISGYEGHYEVSDLGRVRSLDRVVPHVRSKSGTCRRVGLILKPGIDTDGYCMVLLYRDGRRELRKVHQLVLEAFAGPCPAGMQGCHDNRTPADNRLKNLRWDTPEGNHADRVRHGTDPVGERNPAAKLVAAQVLRIRKLRARGITQRKCATIFGVSKSLIGEIDCRRAWAHLQSPGECP